MTSSPSVSVIIPVKNGAAHLREQLDALEVQLEAPSFEVLVCDNGSSDGTAEVVATTAPRTYELRLIDAGARPGAGHARNQGVLHARAELVLFCDADDRVDRNWVAAMTAAHREWPEAVLAGRLVLDGIDNPMEVPSTHWGAESSIDTVIESRPRPVTTPAYGYLAAISGCNFGLARAEFLRLRGMDELSLRAQDLEFAWRAQESGLRVVSVPGAIVHYRLPTSTNLALRKEYRTALAYQRLRAIYRPAAVQVAGWRWTLATLVKLCIKLLNPVSSPELRAGRRLQLVKALGHLHGLVKFGLPRGRPAQILLERATQERAGSGPEKSSRSDSA